MKKVFILLIALLFSFHSIQAQHADSCGLQISILTCAPADELYATFGHSAIRVIDSVKHTDIVFNYGTFDFSDPDFYTKFMRGHLDYFLSIEPYNSFTEQYIEDKRTIYEQILHLTCEEKQRIYAALIKNLEGSNRYYKYDFLYDNCTTRIRDMVFNNVNGSNVRGKITPEGTTFRNMLHEYLDKGGKPWSKLGIDILLGSPVDKKVSVKNAMFLPDYLMKGIDSTVVDHHSLIVASKNIALLETPPDTASGKYQPLIWSMIFSLFIVWMSFTKAKWAGITLKLLDSFLLYATGIVGILLAFMWTGTDHWVCKYNYNLFWALPTNFVAAFFIWKKPQFIKKYFTAAAVITGMFLAGWFIMPQQINIALLPLSIVALFRYIKLAQPN
ncbi:MAG: DUF4105 domain-containing protein [Bacteroidota bacterium]|nr:DUF4105 domain-containing protein [Bacteroidota bacterium]